MKLKMLPLYLWNADKPMKSTRRTKRLDEVPYGGKLGYYLLGNKSWIVSENGYFEMNPDDFKEKLYIMNIPSLSDKELNDLANKIESGSYNTADVKLYNCCNFRNKLYVPNGFYKIIIGDMSPVCCKYQWH